MQINIDKFELFQLCKVAAMGSHLMQGIWERCINEFYDKLTPDERLWLYTYVKCDWYINDATEHGTDLKHFEI